MNLHFTAIIVINFTHAWHDGPMDSANYKDRYSQFTISRMIKNALPHQCCNWYRERHTIFCCCIPTVNMQTATVTQALTLMILGSSEQFLKTSPVTLYVWVGNLFGKKQISEISDCSFLSRFIHRKSVSRGSCQQGR